MSKVCVIFLIINHSVCIIYSYAIMYQEVSIKINCLTD